MIVYSYFFVALSLLVILLEMNLTRSARLSLLVLIWLILVVFAGLRWQTGNDWTPYYEYYQHLTSLQDQSAAFELGYRIFSLLVKSLGLPYSVFLLLYTAVYMGLYMLSFIEADINLAGWIALGFYCTYLLGLMGTNRQVMGLAICLFSMRYVFRRKLIPFLTCIVFAVSFHISAICFLIVWPLSRVRLKLGYLLIAAILVGAAGAAGAGPALLRSLGKSGQNVAFFAKVAALNADPETHVSDAAAGNPEVRLYVKRGLYLFFFIVGYRYLKDQRWRLYLILFILSVTIAALLYSVDPVIASRLAVYFSIFEVFLLALYTRAFRTPALRTLYAVLLIGLLYHGLWTGVYSTHPKIFAPYKAIWINQDVWRNPGWF